MRLIMKGLRRREAHDVVFYTPWIGSILSSRQLLPPGGAETQVLILAKALADAGLRVGIIAYGDREELPATAGGVTIIPRPPWKPKGRLGRATEIFHIWRSLWRSPSSTIICRTAGYDLGLIAMYARVFRRRLVFSCPNVVAFDWHKIEPRRTRQLIYNLGVRLADAIVLQTDEQVERCAARFGRDGVLIRSISPLGPPQEKPPEAFLWVGRLVWYKRPLEYIALARALPEAKFWMVGVPSPIDDEEGVQFAQTVTTAADAVPNLELLAPRPNAEIGRLMARAVASVNTADFEGMPNVLLEGWSRGVPALVLNHDPSGAVQKHDLGDFAHGSIETLIAQARRQWLNRTDRAALSAQCRKYIENYHDAHRVADEWLHVLRASRRRQGKTGSDAQTETVCVGS